MKDINFNENIIEENDSTLLRNKSVFTSNLNPYVSYERSKQRTDNNSLEYLKDISKSDTLKTKKEEEEENDYFSNDKKLFANIETRRKIKRNSKVSFKENISEPEEKKGIFSIKKYRKNFIN